jgi:hypothetical protein
VVYCEPGEWVSSLTWICIVSILPYLLYCVGLCLDKPMACAQEANKKQVDAELESIFRSSATANAIKEKLTDYAFKATFYPSMEELRCQDKSFLVNDVGLNEFHANVLLKSFCPPPSSTVHPSAGLTPTPGSAGSGSLNCTSATALGFPPNQPNM